MEDGKPSQTAQMVAMLRARHHLQEPEPKILRDSLAAELGNAPSEAEVMGYLGAIEQAFSGLSDPDTAKKFVRQLEHSVCIRARLVEEEIVQAKDKGATQFVVLGAGLDSTAYRELELCKGLSVFEVDHPASQGWKKNRLAEAGIDIPGNVSFVPFDFENTTLDDALKNGGVNKDEVTVLSWLGVQMYLTDDAVKATLSVAAGFERGSALIMDFVSPEYKTSTHREDNSVDALRKIVSGMSEPFLSEYMPVELADRFSSAGFSASEFPKIRDFANQYLDGNLNRLDMHPEAQYLAIARV